MRYEFKCENEKCPKHDVIIEEDVKLAEVDITEVPCEVCGKPTTRLISYLKTRHKSWGTWKV